MLCDRLLNITKGSKLWIKEYSKKLFENVIGTSVFVTDDFNCDALTGDYCFLEIENIDNYIDNTEKIILFRWNRDYPYDMSLPKDFKDSWKLVSSDEFSGNSHETITIEEYKKCASSII
jgi:hypothetical protein